MKPLLKPLIISSALLLLGAATISHALPFFDHTSSDAKTTSTQAVTQKQLQRLVKTIQIIQSDYINNVDEKTLMDKAINGMVSRLDPHSAYLDKQEMANLQTTVSGEFVGIGVELTTERGLLRVVSPIANSPAAKAGLKPGDTIVKVDNHLIQDMSVNEAINDIKGKPGTTVTLTVLRKNEQKPIVMNIVRSKVKVDAVKSKLLAPGYGYIQLSIFQGNVVDELKQAINTLTQESQGHLKGLVLDLRNNPGGLLDVSAGVVDLFLDKNETAQYHNVIVYTKGRVANADVKYYAHDEDMIPHVPMVVLINGGSASASEITAGALQDYKRAIIMGTRSFGKGSVQTIIPISDNSALKLTTALYYTPAGREIQAQGIEPNVIVPELSIGEKQSSSFNLDEANYDNHIANHGSNAINVATKSEENNITLAKDDYQLYEALMMLKGMHAMH